MSVETRLRAGPPQAPAKGSDQVTEEVRLTRRALREAQRGAAAATTSPTPAGTPRTATPAPAATAEASTTVIPRVPRRTSALPPARAVYVTSRRARPEVVSWSPRTLLVLAALCVVTLVVGTALVVRTVTAQRLNTEGARDATALTAALEAARADVALLADAVDATRPLARQAGALADALAPRTADVSAEAVAAVIAAAAELDALVTEPVTEPALPTRLADLSGLPGDYVSADAETRAALRDAVATQLELLPTLADRASGRGGELADAVAAVRVAVAAAIRAAADTAATTLSATPEAPADSRARFEATVAALAALGDVPELDTTTGQAFDAYFTAADALRRSHEEAVKAREFAELAAAEEAAAAAAAAAAEEAAAAERKAAEDATERPRWWRDSGRDGND